MKTPSERFCDSVKDAEKVFCDIEIGMTKKECQALIDNAYSRFITESKREEQNARKI